MIDIQPPEEDRGLPILYCILTQATYSVTYALQTVYNIQQTEN